MQPSLTASRTIALVAAALSLCTACFYIPSPRPQPPPPDLVTISANLLHFYAAIGHASEPQYLTITNASAQIVSINPQSKWLGAEKYMPFSFQTDCGAELAPGASCTITLTFRPVSSDHTIQQLWLDFQNHESHTIWLKGTIGEPSTPKSPSATP